MLFQVKRLPSINSADQYLVSSPQTTEVSANSSYPLLLKYHNFGDTNSYFKSPCYLLEQCSPNGVCNGAAEDSKVYLTHPEEIEFQNLFDFKKLQGVGEMSTTNSLSHRGLVGLYNLENSCFLNSIIQCLRFTKPLVLYIHKNDYVRDLHGSYPQLVEEFSKLIKSLWSFSTVTQNAFSPRPFAQAIQHFAPEFDGYTQQDAHEFLLCILAGLHENLNLATLKCPRKVSSADVLQGHAMWQNYLSSENSRIIDIFVGQLRSTLMCTYCNKTSSTFDPFWDLSLPIPICPEGATSIQHCLRACLSDERIDGVNMPFCNQCKSRKASQKQLAIHKLPKILILHLKRFTEDQEKLNIMVDFPVKSLDLSPFCSAGITSGLAKYNLYAVVNHTGSMSYGHYTAFCHHPFMNEWFEFNDHYVTQLESAASVVTNKAYILFYELFTHSSKL